MESSRSGGAFGVLGPRLLGVAFVVLLAAGALPSAWPAATPSDPWHAAPAVEADSDVLRLPYAPSGVWLAGDAHVHSVSHSQSALPSSAAVATTSEAMKRAGLDFAVITDHDTVTRLPTVDGFLLVPGIEVTANRPDARAHVVGIGATAPVPWPSMTNQQVLTALENQGAMAVLAHPDARGEWTSGPSWPTEAVAALSNYSAVEMYNHMVEVKGRAGGSGWALDAWFAALSTGRPVWGLSVGDVHGEGAFGYGFFVVQADAADAAAVREALERGRFVSVVTPTAGTVSVWPSRIATVDGALTVETSPTHSAQTIIFYDAVGQVRHSAAAASATYAVAGNEGFVVVELRGADAARVFLQPIQVGDGRMAAGDSTENAVDVAAGPAPEVGMGESQTSTGSVAWLAVAILSAVVVAVLVALAAWRRRPPS